MEAVGKTTLQVVKRKDRPSPKVIVNLPYPLLNMGFNKGDAFIVYANEKYIILSRDGTIPKATDEKKEELLNSLVQLFTLIAQSPEGKRVLAKHKDLVQKIVSLL